MFSVEDVKGLIIEAITAFKLQLDPERDELAGANADMIRTRSRL